MAVGATSLISRMVKPGDTGDDVMQLQLLLRAVAIRQSAKKNDTLQKTVPSLRTKRGIFHIADKRSDWADGSWGKDPSSPTTIALHTFQKMAKIPITDHVAPNDLTVLGLADEADILIELSLRDGIDGLLDFNDEVRQVTYEPGADGRAPNVTQCSFRGLQGFPGFVVQLQHGGIAAGPVLLNCTTYANLAVSIYMHGNANNGEYDADLSKIGDAGPHLACNYGFAIMDRADLAQGRSVFNNGDEIGSYAKEDRLYSIECAGAGGNVHHEAVMYNGIVYHSWPNGGYALPTIMSDTLAEFDDRVKPTGVKYFYVLQEPVAGDPIVKTKSHPHPEFRINVTADELMHT